jgi:hypothetical protein
MGIGYIPESLKKKESEVQKVEEKPLVKTEVEGKPEVKREPDGKWVKGQSGNPTGTKTQANVRMVRDFTAKMLPMVCQKLEEMLKDENVKDIVKVKLIEIVLDRSCGRSYTPGRDPDDEDQEMKDPKKMSREELEKVMLDTTKAIQEARLLAMHRKEEANV